LIRQKTEDGRRKTEDGRRKAEDQRPKTDELLFTTPDTGFAKLVNSVTIFTQ